MPLAVYDDLVSLLVLFNCFWLAPWTICLWSCPYDGLLGCFPFILVGSSVHVRLYTCLWTESLCRFVPVSKVVYTCESLHMFRGRDNCRLVIWTKQVSRVVHAYVFVHMHRGWDTCCFVQVSRIVHAFAFVHVHRGWDTCLSCSSV